MTADAFKAAYDALPPDVILLELAMPDEDRMAAGGTLIALGYAADSLAFGGFSISIADGAPRT